MVVSSFSGGDAFEKKMAEIKAKVGNAQVVRVGFLESAGSEPGGISIAEVAAIQEFGAKIKVDAHTQTIYRLIDDNGNFKNNGRFVKAAKSNFASDHAVSAHTITIPSRPYFRNMIKENSMSWSGDMAKIMKAAGYDAGLALARMGERIAGQLTKSIRDFSTPENAASTIRKKGFNDPLIDKGDMVRAVDSEVVT